MAQRIKGQETEIILIVNSQPQFNITTIKNFDFSWDLETTDEGYMGETTNRKDSIYKGVSGKIGLHIENQDILKFAAAIIDKARRRTPGTRINIKTALNFPNGQRPKIIIPDAEFGQLPFSFPDRASYLDVTVNYAAAEAFTILS